MEAMKINKGVVMAKDTPEFIANRIGAYNMNQGLSLARLMNLSVAQLDTVVGPILGWFSPAAELRAQKEISILSSILI